LRTVKGAVLNETLAWKNLSVSDAQTQSEALDALCHHLRAPLERFLIARCQASNPDAEDAVQMALVKLCKHCGAHVWPNEQAGRAWLYRTVRTCYVDVLRSKGALTTIPLEDYEKLEVPFAERGFAEQVQAAILLGEIFHYADSFWLGLDPSLSPATCERLLLVAQMYYLEGFSSALIPRLLGCAPAEEPEMTSERVLAWVREPGVIRLLAYRTLCMERRRLLAYLLGLEETEVSPGMLSALWQRALVVSPEEPALGELSWAMVALILLRYRDNAPASAVPAQSPCRTWGYTAEQIEERIAAIRACLPFDSVMTDLLECMENDRIDTGKVLGDPGLWKRLAFQYWYCEEIPLGDVYERIHPASDQVAYKLNTNMLNTWLSGGQLRKMLVKRWWDHCGGDCDE
jgi:hypothetical protein